MNAFVPLFLLAAASTALAQLPQPLLTTRADGITVRATRIATPMSIDG